MTESARRSSTGTWHRSRDLPHWRDCSLLISSIIASTRCSRPTAARGRSISALLARLLELPADDLRRRQRDADAAFLQQGITFTVYGDKGGTERIFPFDLLPRILTAAEWETISAA